MKIKACCERLITLVLTSFVALTICQFSGQVAAQKTDKPKTSHAAPASVADKKSATRVSALPINAEYSAKIKEYTTQSYFSTELVDYLPASDRVPSPDKAPNLREKFDVIVFPPVGGSAQSIVNGIPMRGAAIPWKASEQMTDEQRLQQGPFFTPPALRPRVVLRFAADEKSLLISGMLAGGSELANAPAVVDVPVGKGHIVIFASNPLWRHQTQGSFFLLFNAALNYDHLNVGRERPANNGGSAKTDDDN